MLKKIGSVVIMVSILTACGNTEEVAPIESTPVEEENRVTLESLEKNIEGIDMQAFATDTSDVLDIDITKEYIEENLEVGLSKDDIKSLLGSKYVNVINAMYGNEMWRYDIKPQQGYVFETKDYSDEVDILGLKEDKLEMVLFVDWHEEKVSEYALYYKDKKNNKLHELRIDETGVYKNNVIE